MKSRMKWMTAVAVAIFGLGSVATAAPILEDGIAVGGGDYSTGALVGQTGTPETGGYDGAWAGQTFTGFGDPAVVGTGLSYADGSLNVLDVSGGSVEMNRTDSATTLEKSADVDPSGTPALTSSNSVYFSGLIQLGGANWASIGIRIGPTGSKSVMGIGINNAGFGQLRENGAVIGLAGSALTGWSSGDTVFVVGKIENNGAGAGDDELSLFLNPTLSAEPGTATVSTGVGTQGWFPTQGLEVLRIEADLNGEQPATYFDEFRIGETWADVTPHTFIPEPATAGLLGLAGLALLRRRRRV